MENFKFNYTLLREQVFNLDPSKIKQIYAGRLNNCRCGCAGDYYTPGDKDYEGMLLSALQSMQSNHYDIKMDFWDDEDYIEWETTTKEIYLDHGNYETAHMGFAIYLNK